MKITWFGKSTFRIYVGGKIVVINPQVAPGHLAQEELRAGADETLSLDDLSSLALIDPQSWQKNRPARLVDETDSGADALNLWRLDEGGVLIDAAIENAVSIVENPMTQNTRANVQGIWVIWGEPTDIEVTVENVLTNQHPSVIALAMTGVTEQQMARLAQVANGRTILILEPELALEV